MAATNGASQHDDPPEDWDNDDSASGTEGPGAEQLDEVEVEDDSHEEIEEEPGSPSEADDADVETQILTAYRKLLSRRVDLVGDYAGNELFLIDGDSMLLRCFSDDKLDFDVGFQLLHAGYNVEYFLHQLAKRKCNFHIVFFSANKSLCVPPNTDPANASKYLLARAAVIRHLEVNLQNRYPGIKIEEFASYESSEFKDYLKATSPYFLMAHDGAAAVPRKGQHADETEKATSLVSQRVALRDMICHFIQNGFNVALVNGLEWRDTKVMAMVLERRSRGDSLKTASTSSLHPIDTPGVDMDMQLGQFGGLAAKFTEREALAILVVCLLLQAAPLNQSGQELNHSCSAFLLHVALLQHLPLSARRFDLEETSDRKGNRLNSLALLAESILQNREWRSMEFSTGSRCDVIDFLDGRLLAQVLGGHVSPSSDVRESFEQYSQAVQKVSGLGMTLDGVVSSDSQTSSNGHAVSPAAKDDLAVMPFSNAVFDKHLASVHLHIDEKSAIQPTAASHRIFREVTHWHNAKKPLIQRGPANAALSDRQKVKADRRNQMFMDEMAKYSASLTNAVGKSLDPESIIVGASKLTASKTSSLSRADPADSDSADSASTASSKKSGPQSKKGGGGKNAQNASKKQAMMAQIAATQAKKEGSISDKALASWQKVCKDLDADKDPRSKYRKARVYSGGLQSSWREVIGAECELYMLNALLGYWIDVCRHKEKDARIEVAGLIWSHAGSISQSNSLTKEILTSVEATVETLGLPPTAKRTASTLPSRKLAFTFALPSKVEALSVDHKPKDFQLKHCGPYLERSFDSAPDDRVDFQPDGWQRKVLDGIDANKSLFVVAPTSAGKTFISFYAMRKILEADDDSVLVYVAPTKALVNQIAAEIQARYSKKFKYGGRSVWAIHTRDYRINNPTGCQVLVTVPHVLQIMLLAPTNANAWSSRVKRIIFDEVHSIGQAEDGVVWEQLLLLSPCPIIALSATVGNPNEFSDWLISTQRAIGIELVNVQHPYRYSDLRKYYYLPPQRFHFGGIPEKSAFGTLGLEGTVGFNQVHPVAALVDKSRGIPQDLALEPKDCFELYNAMVKQATADYPVPDKLNPENALPDIMKKADILAWERGLKELLQNWLADDGSPYDTVLAQLERPFRDTEREALQSTRSSDTSTKGTSVPEDLLKTTLPMLCRLHEQDALPAILFNYDRNMCEDICRALLSQLQDAELSQQKSGPKWEKKLERWEEWKKVQEKSNSRQAKASSKKSKSKDDTDDADKTSKLDQQRESAGGDVSQWDSFDPDAPMDEYHFADYSRVQLSEMEIYVKQLRWRDIPSWLIDALQRGIGIHHAGMNRKYRQIVEILFRKGFLRVVIATGTLALGINMPCKTVVFSGDSVFLTALNFRQCAGRAGRRGFDLLGNVVFQGVSREKVCRLISSRLPDLNGHFPITTTLVLRLFTLLTESKNSKYATSAINALLSQPRLFMGGPSFKDQTMHHLRFSIEYLRRQYLLGADGRPLNFAGLVSHLYFTENSSFAFHALLKEGYFHELCEGIKHNQKDTLETLMLVMAHLFSRIYCRQADQEYREKVVKPSSSIVFLPPLPKQAAQILREHNKQTLRVYYEYVATFVDQHISSEDNTLPLSGMTVGKEGGEDVKDVHALPATRIRSAFAALSGKGDTFDSISDLCQTTREGVFLEEDAVPHVANYPEELDQPLNAWLLDFFKHGDVHTIERANGIRRADIWFLLNDFSLVLATIIASLMNFMKLKEGTDLDMLDIMGDLDAHEEAEDDNVAASEQQSEASGPSVADSAIVVERPKLATKKKAKNADSWEDQADEEEEIVNRTSQAANGQATDAAAWEGEAGSGEGLRNVLKAFSKLHAEFTIKFKAMWA